VETSPFTLTHGAAKMLMGGEVLGLRHDSMRRCEIHFDAGHNGPPRVVQGGTLAGRMAEILGGPTEVTLRRPVRLSEVGGAAIFWREPRPWFLATGTPTCVVMRDR
jgi:hypothetical protein